MGGFPRGLYNILAKFQLYICNRKGVNKNVFFYFGRSNCLVYISKTVCCSLDQVWSLDMLFHLFFFFFLQIPWHFLNTKKGIGYI